MEVDEAIRELLVENLTDWLDRLYGGMKHWISKIEEAETVEDIMRFWFHPNLYGAGMSYGGDRWKSTWDVVFYAVKGKKAKHGKKVAEEGYKLNPHGGGFDVMVYSQPRPLLHKAQKPLELVMKLVHCSSNEGDVVLDPFLGSGTTAVACEKLKRRWIGIEIEEKFCEVAKKRIEEELRVKKLF